MGDQLSVTLEAIDASNNRLLWQTTVSAPVNDLIALQSQLSTQVQQGLLPVLGGAGGALQHGLAAKEPGSLRSFSCTVSRCPMIPSQIKTRIAGVGTRGRSGPRLRARMGGAGTAVLL